MSSYTLAPFRDIEYVVMDGLEARFAELDQTNVGIVTPSNLNTRVAGGGVFVRVHETPGGRDDRMTSFAVLDIDVFAGTRDASKALAEAIRAWLLGYPIRVGTAALDRVETVTAPFQAPWENEAVWRRLGTYRISTRR